MSKFCDNCGKEIKEGADVCLGCGKNIKSAGQTVNNTTIINNNGKGPYNKWVAVLLCFFLGVIGIHKFYEGKTGMGILYIFTGGLFGIGVLVDFIVLLCKPDPYYL